MNTRHERLSEAVTIIRGLLDGDTVNFRGQHYHVDSAQLWDRHHTPIPIGVAVSGRNPVDWRGGRPTI